jgi:hypothetical protein
MSSYLPDKVFAVCTNQIGGGYKQLTIDAELRPAANQTVNLGTQSRVFLVRLDKKLTSDFVCKTGCSSGVGTMAFGAGVLTGLAVAATVATVPVAGWIVGGIIAVGCLIYGAIQILKSPTCSQMISYDESKWVMYHQTVKFDSINVSSKEKHLALVKRSMLICKEGGVVLPFISESLAQQAASKIQSFHRGDVVIAGVTGFVSGFMVGFSFGTAGAGTTALWSIGKDVIVYGGWMVIGHYVINPAAGYVGEKTGEWTGGESYNKIKEVAVKKDPEWSVNDEYDVKGDASDIRNLDLKGMREAMVKNGANKSDIAAIDKAIAKGKETGSLAMDKNPEMKEVLTKIKNGEFGPEAKRIYTNSKGNMRGMNTEANAKETVNSKKTDIRTNRKSAIDKTKGLGGILQFLQPFVSSILAERAIVLAGDLFDQDASNSVAVSAKDF